MGDFYTIASTGAKTSKVNGCDVIEISQLSDFPTPVGSVISLDPNTTYVIRGEVDILDNRIDVQVDNVAIVGYDRNKDILKASTLVGTMITVGDMTLATNTEYSFTLDNLRLEVRNGKVLEAANINQNAPGQTGSVFGRTAVLQVSNCEITQSTSCWKIIGFELVDLINNLIWFIDGNNATDGCRFQSVRHLEITSCEFFNWDVADASNASRMIEIMPDLISTFDGFPLFNAVININSSIIHPENDQIGLYVDTSSSTKFGTIASNTFISVNLNIPTGQLIEPTFGSGGYSLPCLLAYDIGLNQGIPNSTAYQIGSLGVAKAAIPATGGGNFTLIPTTPDYNVTAGNENRFTGASNGVVTYNGKKNILAQVSAILGITGNTGGQPYSFAIAVNGVHIPASIQTYTPKQNADETIVTLLWQVPLEENDTIELQYDNSANTWDLNSMQFSVKE